MTVSKQELQAILDKVHHLFDYEYDSIQFGKEYWMGKEEIKAALDLGRDEFKGDCDDLALACRALCREAEIDSRLVFCVIPPDGYHLALEVDGYILDNTSKWLRSRDDLDWKWISISGYDFGDPWHTIKGD